MTALVSRSLSSQERHTDIIAKLEKAIGPDRELDCLICEWNDPRFAPAMRGSYYGEFTGEYFQDGYVVAKARYYTRSLDAALALVEEKMSEPMPVMRCLKNGWRASVFAGINGFPTVAPTAPLALLQSLFKALEAQ